MYHEFRTHIKLYHSTKLRFLLIDTLIFMLIYNIILLVFLNYGRTQFKKNIYTYDIFCTRFQKLTV